DLGLQDAERPEVDHDTKGTAGWVDINSAILAKIAASAIFVADVTPIATSPDGKALPNPNVLVELGYALGKGGYERMIPVMNTASGFIPDQLPFDLKYRRTMRYELSTTATAAQRTKAKERLVEELVAAFKLNLAHHRAEKATSIEIR